MSRTPMNNALTVRRAAAAIGASAVVTMLAISVGVAQQAPETSFGANGATTTPTTPPTAPLISSAAPVVKATYYGKH